MVIAAVLVVAALVPVFGGAYPTTFLVTLLYAYIIAQSWDWLHGEAGYVNLGHYIYFGIGAYAFALANVNGVPVVASFIIAALFTGVMGALLSFPLFRLRGDYFAFATLALLPLFELLASNLVDITRGSDGILLPPTTAMIHGIDVKMYAYYVALAASVAVFVVSIWMSRSAFGYALKAIRNDEQAAEVARHLYLSGQAAGDGLWRDRRRGRRRGLYLVVPLHRPAHRVRPRRRPHSGGHGAARRFWPVVGTIDWRRPAVGRHPASHRQPDDAAIHHHRPRYPADRPLHARRAVTRAMGAACAAAAPLGHEHHERIAATAAAVMPDASGVLPLERIAADRSRIFLPRAISPWPSAAMSPSTA